MSILDVLLNHHLQQGFESDTEQYQEAENELASICELLKSEKGIEMADQLENCTSVAESEIAKKMYKQGFSDAMKIFLETYSNK